MSRILHLIGSDSIGGPEKQLLHHARDTRDSGYQIILGSFQENAETPEILGFARRCGIETVSIPGGIRPGLVDDLRQYLLRHGIDMVCTHGYKANVVGHFAARNAKVPWVPFVDGFTAETWQVTLYERLERGVLVRSAWVVCSSPAQARELGRMRRGRRAPLVIQNAVVPLPDADNPPARSPTREELGFSRGDFVFGVAARLTREKGHGVLLQAFALLSAMLPDQSFRLLLLGEGREEGALRAQARRLGIEPCIRFAGCQPKSSAWMKIMDCLVHPALADGTLSAMLEAMLLKIPVIATNLGGVSEIVLQGKTGLLAAPGQPAILAEAMKKLARSSPLRHQLALEGKRHVEENFSSLRQRELFEILYRTLLGNAFTIEVKEPLHGVA